MDPSNSNSNSNSPKPLLAHSPQASQHHYPPSPTNTAQHSPRASTGPTRRHFPFPPFPSREASPTRTTHTAHGPLLAQPTVAAPHTPSPSPGAADERAPPVSFPLPPPVAPCPASTHLRRPATASHPLASEPSVSAVTASPFLSPCYRCCR
jgi:hypothetical protein